MPFLTSGLIIHSSFKYITILKLINCIGAHHFPPTHIIFFFQHWADKLNVGTIHKHNIIYRQLF